MKNKSRSKSKKNPLHFVVCLIALAVIGVGGVLYVSASLRSQEASLQSDASNNNITACNQLNNKGKKSCKSVSGCSWTPAPARSCKGLNPDDCYSNRPQASNNSVGCTSTTKYTPICTAGLNKYCAGPAHSNCVYRSLESCVQDNPSPCQLIYEGTNVNVNTCENTPTSQCSLQLGCSIINGKCRGEHKICTNDSKNPSQKSFCEKRNTNGVDCYEGTPSSCYIQSSTGTCSKYIDSAACNQAEDLGGCIWDDKAKPTFICEGNYQNPMSGTCSGEVDDKKGNDDESTDSSPKPKNNPPKSPAPKKGSNGGAGGSNYE